MPGLFNASFGFGQFAEAVYHISASETEQGKKRLDEYYVALGRFIDMFAQVEIEVNFTLWHYAKTSTEISKFIFSGDRIDNSAQYIKQIAEATKVAKALRNDLKDIFDQLGIISGNRNHIVHYGAQSIAEGKGMVSNAFKAKGDPKEFPISPIALEEMTTDLRKISFHLRYVHYSGSHLHMRSQAGDLDKLNEILLSPWRYKHPPQKKSQSRKGAQRPTRKRDQSRSHRPSSSPQ
jgi:hypothetical protein